MAPEWVFLGLRLLLAAALYGFFGFLLWYLWQDARRRQRTSAEVPAARLAVIEGPEAGGWIHLSPVNEFGRAADNSIPVQDETVSAYHARLTHYAGQWWIEDLASRNGTRVNDLSVDQPLVVTYGDEIRLGRVRFRLEPAPAPARRSGAQAEADGSLPAD